MGYWTLVGIVINEADIIVLVADARMPELSKNEKLEGIVHRIKKDFLIVFTKIDLLSREAAAQLRREFPNAVFVSGSRNIGISKLKGKLMMMGKKRGLDKPKVGIIGYPNVGKSAIINALAKRARTKVSSKAGTTTGIQWVKAGNLSIVDTPGVIPYVDRELDLAMIGAKNPEKLKRPEKAACDIIRRIVETNKSALEEFYGLPLEGDDFEMFLAIGKKRGFLLKGGRIDENRTAMQIIRDWQRGKLRI